MKNEGTLTDVEQAFFKDPLEQSCLRFRPERQTWHIPKCSTMLEYLQTDPAKCWDRQHLFVLILFNMCFHRQGYRCMVII